MGLTGRRRGSPAKTRRPREEGLKTLNHEERREHEGWRWGSSICGNLRHLWMRTFFCRRGSRAEARRGRGKSGSPGRFALPGSGDFIFRDLDGVNGREQGRASPAHPQSIGRLVGCRGWLKPPPPEEGFWTGFSGSTGLKKKMFSRRDEKTAKEDRNEGVSVPEKRDPGVTPGNGAKPIVIMGRAFSPHGLWAVGPGASPRASPRAGMVSRTWRSKNECPYGCDR